MSYWRSRILGLIKLVTPLSLADGEFTARSGGETGSVLTVARTGDGRAVIPGSSLKGVLREYMQAHGVASSVIENLFGRSAQEKVGGQKSADLGQGGKVEFGYCYSRSAVTVVDEMAVAINRVTRAAAERQLFARQVVPADTVFDVELLGFALGENEIAALLTALDGFNRNAPDRVRLGAGTYNNFGAAEWKLQQVAVLDKLEVTAWLQDEHPGDLWAAARTLDRQQLPALTIASRPHFQVDLRLDFSSWFLVRDPTAEKRSAKNWAVTNRRPNRRDTFPRLTPDNYVLLPAPGFRGAFRSQVERIARTLCPSAGGDPNRDAPVGSSKVIESLFGETGYRSVIQCSNFIDERPAWDGADHHGALPEAVIQRQCTALLPREFVAIDRFTGGAAEHLKFDCVAAWRPQLLGQLSFDIARMMQQCDRLQVKPAAAFGLLLLALRDLCDGDVTFGFGAGKGFGECQASIVSFQLPPPSVLVEGWGLASEWESPPPESADTAQGPFLGLTADQRRIVRIAVGSARSYLTSIESQGTP